VWEEGMAENALFVLVSIGRHIHASQPAVVDRVKTNRQHGAFDASRDNTVKERERSIDFIRPSDVGQAGTKREKACRTSPFLVFGRLDPFLFQVSLATYIQEYSIHCPLTFYYHYAL
jgi:hypothetical protein